MQHAINTNLDLLEELVRPDLLKIESNDGLGRARVIRLHRLESLVRIRVSYIWQFSSDIGSFLVTAWRLLLWHQAMEQAVVHEILSILHAQILVILVIELDLAHGGLDVGDEVH